MDVTCSEKAAAFAEQQQLRIVGMVEVIQSDFERLETETEAAEAQAQKEHDEFMNDSSTDKASKAA